MSGRPVRMAAAASLARRRPSYSSSSDSDSSNNDDPPVRRHVTESDSELSEVDAAVRASPARNRASQAERVARLERLSDRRRQLRETDEAARQTGQAVAGSSTQPTMPGPSNGMAGAGPRLVRVNTGDSAPSARPGPSRSIPGQTEGVVDLTMSSDEDDIVFERATGMANRPRLRPAQRLPNEEAQQHIRARSQAAARELRERERADALERMRRIDRDEGRAFRPHNTGFERNSDSESDTEDGPLRRRPIIRPGGAIIRRGNEQINYRFDHYGDGRVGASRTRAERDGVGYLPADSDEDREQRRRPPGSHPPPDLGYEVGAVRAAAAAITNEFYREAHAAPDGAVDIGENFNNRMQRDEAFRVRVAARTREIAQEHRDRHAAQQIQAERDRAMNDLLAGPGGHAAPGGVLAGIRRGLGGAGTLLGGGENGNGHPNPYEAALAALGLRGGDVAGLFGGFNPAGGFGPGGLVGRPGLPDVNAIIDSVTLNPYPDPPAGSGLTNEFDVQKLAPIEIADDGSTTQSDPPFLGCGYCGLKLLASESYRGDEDKVSTLRCGHLMHARCVQELCTPTKEELERIVPPNLEVLGAEEEAKPTYKRRRTRRGMTRAAAKEEEVVREWTWACPVKGCGMEHVSYQKGEGEWQQRAGRGALNVFL